MTTVRGRLAALAAPLGVELPEAYLAYMENPPARGIPIRHLCHRADPPTEWRPAGLDVLEADVHRGRWKRVDLNAHTLQALAAEYLSGGHESVSGPDGAAFATARLARGFWIGEEDGDHVFLDADTGGVFAYLAHEDCVEQWAASFAEFAAKGQQTGRFV